MNQPGLRSLPRPLLAGSLSALLALASFAMPAGAATPLADEPLFSSAAVPGNLALPLSVEYPTAISVAHIGAYSSANAYLGYFDPDKCYVYVHVLTETATSVRHFAPSSAATNHTCVGKWSGNFLNWATMQTIDPFRWALTGGYRKVDTNDLTILEKAYGSNQGGNSNFPDKAISGTTVKGATPWDRTTFNVRVFSLGNKIRFSVSGNVVSGTPIPWDGSVATMSNTVVYEVNPRVKVCDPVVGVEANCKRYSTGFYKPEGLIHKYAERMRFSAFGYLNDSSLSRDGGVLRARQKFVGPDIVVPGQPNGANPAREWDPATGVFVLNPDAADASTTASLFGVPVTNSGVMNYINKFGQITPGTYKTYDPVGELYYTALRYFKRLGNVPEYTSPGSASVATKTTWVDGFPVITSWDDPIQYTCQKNFILGIGDTNTHADKNLPGPTPTAQEPPKPAMVSADTTVDAVAATNKVGQLEGLGTSLGTVNPWGNCCNNNSALMAGLAYDANTKDIRPDLANPEGTIGQTVQTYWLDILEFQEYDPNNQFYLAAKYGGFQVPKDYNPYTNTTPLQQAWWSTNGETVGGQTRPDNYFVASRPDQLVAGLNAAFARIASQMKAFTTSFSTSLPQVSATGNGSYSAQYDANDWTGELVANELTFKDDRSIAQLEKWRLTTTLKAQAAGTGWNTNRRIVTWNGSTGVPFRHASISTAQQAALNTAYVSGDDSANYLNYLRGDRTNERTATNGTLPYRTRAQLVGDIVGSRAVPVAPPSLALSDATNPGYSAFKDARKDRATVVYVGANDGMLHAVDGSLTGTSAGKEIFAYVPAAVFNGPSGTPSVDGLASLGNPTFEHHYLVNATPSVVDIDFGKTVGGSGTDWRTVLIGGLGKGGRSYYAIDVTNPATMTTESAVASKVLWEFSHPDLGYTFGEPTVVKTRRHGWVVILPSGYNNADGKGYFFILNPRTGALLQQVPTGAGSTSADAGLAHANAFVLDRTDGTADAAYAADLLGNVWRVDLTSAVSDYPDAVAIAALKDGADARQPVTTRPLISVCPIKNTRHVLVGTGRLLETSDIVSSQPQSFYAIGDGTGAHFATGITSPISREQLFENKDLTVGIANAPSTARGWYHDFGSASNGSSWRSLIDPASFFGQVSVAATLPNGDACSPAGSSRVYVVNFCTGKTVLKAGAFVPFSGVITDQKFLGLNGLPELAIGTSKGENYRPELEPLSGMGMRRLNWRELQLTE